MDYSHLKARNDIVNTVLDEFEGGVHSAVRMYGENMSKADMDKHSKLVEYSISFNRNDQATINPTPILRTGGHISFVVGVKEGTGTREMLELVDYIHQTFKQRWIGKCRTSIPRDVGSYGINGWKLHRVDVPFRFDSTNFNTP